jgi:hypothetical protein
MISFHDQQLLPDQVILSLFYPIINVIYKSSDELNRKMDLHIEEFDLKTEKGIFISI